MQYWREGLRKWGTNNLELSSEPGLTNLSDQWSHNSPQLVDEGRSFARVLAGVLLVMTGREVEVGVGNVGEQFMNKWYMAKMNEVAILIVKVFESDKQEWFLHKVLGVYQVQEKLKGATNLSYQCHKIILS